MEKLIIKGARQHNLKNITLELPKNKLIVFTGLSGSGKSSLAFDTIYAEGQRRYVESLSSYARQFLGIMDKPDVDAIIGLSPAISIDQKSTSHNPRSTVGTVTEIYDYLRLLYARIGHPHCPNCGREVQKLDKQQIVMMIFDAASQSIANEGKKLFKCAILSPVVRDRKGEFTGLFDTIRAKGYRMMRVDGRFLEVNEDILLIKTNKHSVDVVVDRLTLDQETLSFLKNNKSKRGSLPDVAIKSRIADALEQALNLSGGLVIVSEILDKGFSIPDKPKETRDHIYSEQFSCPVCNISIAEIEPRSFSFNSPHGACAVCTGLGKILTVDPERVINTNLSISEGGILPFAKMFFHDTWFSRVVTTVAAEHGIDLRAPLSLLTKTQRSVLLYGTGDRNYLVRGQNRFGDQTTISECYPGLVHELKRRFSQSESDFVREEIQKYMREEVCQDCAGTRLKKESLTVTVNGVSISEVTAMSIQLCHAWMVDLGATLVTISDRTIATPIIKEILSRLQFLVAVGLEYLTLSRTATTLSGGEAQRIRLASQIGSGLSGVLYVLDEPSIGLHQRDNTKLIHTLQKLRDLGNTVIVVEHDRETIEEADRIVDFGPGAGEHGGAIVAEGTVSEIKLNKHSLTAQYLTGKRTIGRPRQDLHNNDSPNSLPHAPSLLTIKGATRNNLKNVDTSFPLGQLICVTGVSGSGKSSLVVETLYPALINHTNTLSHLATGAYERIEGLERVDKAILIDQSPIGRTPRSNPATYTGAFTYIRELFASLSESRLRGYHPGRFSFNVKGGRCEACEGEAQKKIEMQFLSDVYVSCEVCHGTRYDTETLEVTYQGKSIADVLAMTIEEALALFHNHPGLVGKLQTIVDVGLSYIRLGQPAPTLSGGEAQRVKLASELSRRATGKTVYILDEPTTGLHFADLEKLLHVLHRLTALGNTVIVIEHNLDIIKNADWIIDLGPDGGERGGLVVATGTPRDVSRVSSSYTGQYIKNILE
ncbi:excinuclease ABC subunit A [Candidatus Gottesmanbacteria bacterium RIFCSPLOWO2_01_FULL_49_10]|uniref:UvrABC system protein A n=1 Tax=Candidatus Gottesmanbacteria bacterium RIFCSPLOWO2_01_FULL_49_10 TaxID=1798396 RepID=A0A1F6B0I7_9BACT|nr:MAG: excinuclease ABC subunit A [Candidatus Gottesmanbacteria bacterium RIFCSPLOWO2_01_FULL_49_10]